MKCLAWCYSGVLEGLEGSISPRTDLCYLSLLARSTLAPLFNLFPPRLLSSNPLPFITPIRLGSHQQHQFSYATSLGAM